jgi:hypothetical protein
MIDNGKAKVENSFDLFKLTIPSKKNWFGLLFGTVWLGGWYFGFQSALTSLSNFSDGSGFLIFWLLGWTVGGIAIMIFLLWGYFGKEIIDIEYNQLTFSKTVFGIGKIKKLETKDISNFRTEFVDQGLFGNNKWAFWGLGPGKIKFDNGLRTFSFGLGVDDAEATYLVDLLQTKLKLK